MNLCDWWFLTFPDVLINPFVVLGEEVQAPGSETQEDPGAASPAQQARGESADQEAAEERPPLLHPQICSQSLEAVSNKEIVKDVCLLITVSLSDWKHVATV